MNEHLTAQKIAQHLDSGLEEIPAGVLYRLRLARDTALARVHDDAPAAVAVGSRGALRSLNPRVLVPVFGLVLGLSVALYWQQQQMPPAPDYAELDAQVLSDELPVTAYLDQGFEVWLASHHSTD